MKIAVVGAQGQVARALVERGALNGMDICAFGRPELDLLRPSSIAAALFPAKADVIVNAAAYTAVDRAEDDQVTALRVNGLGAGLVAGVASDLGVPVIHLSTDYVFDGRKGGPYTEDDETLPTSVYGESKLAGEYSVAKAGANHAILRAAWIYSPFGANFLKAILRAGLTRDTIAVVDDQYGAPTHALDLADGILRVCANLHRHPTDPTCRGLFHISAAGAASWAEFAQALLAHAAALGRPVVKVKPIASTEYPSVVRRPANSRLDASRLARVHGVQLPDWRQSVRDCVARVIAGEAGC